MRYDDHDTFGNESTGRATLAWSATPTTIVRASYGEGFKAPTLFQLFSEFGNEALAPERADAWDAGIEQHLLDDSLLLSATYFGRNTRNMIDFVSCFANTDPRCTTRPFGFYDNVQKTEVDGFELGVVAHLGERLRFDANYTDMETTNRGAGANFGRELPRRPGQTLNGELAYRVADRPDHDGRGHSRRPQLRQRLEHRGGRRIHAWSICAPHSRSATTWSCMDGSRTRSTRSTRLLPATELPVAGCSWEYVRASDSAQRALQIAAGRFAHHGGRLGVARSLFPDVQQPWVDLSTGINPRSYPAPRASQRSRNRLPDPTELARLEALAAATFGVDDPARVVATAGTECALRLLPQLVSLKAAVIVGPTYGSHADAWTRAGALTQTIGLDEVRSHAERAVCLTIVNPNNPDGRIVEHARLLELHDSLAATRRDAHRR